MLLTITTTHAPATDIGYLLEKHPGKLHTFELACGSALVFYPEARDERCTVALLLTVDPIGLVRKSGARPADAALDQYVNDRPYVASSFLSVAIGTAFRSALAGKSRQRPELAASPIPLEVFVPVVTCHGGEARLRQLFEPLGYVLEVTQAPLDERFPEWGASPYCSLRLTAQARLQDVLRHLYVLIPVLDNHKHYWVDEAEVAKLMRHATEWLGAHPLKEWITLRYLKHRRSLAREALAQLMREEEATAADAGDDVGALPADAGEAALEAGVSLNERRLAQVSGLVASLDVNSVVDLGCGEGRLLERLLQVRPLERIAGMDVSLVSLERAAGRLNLERMAPRERARITLLHGSLLYQDRRLQGFDAACLVEVIEHLDPPRLAALERTVFGEARPRFVILTTPNREYNVRFPHLPAGRFRHADHRFEWSRAELAAWCARQCDRFGYQVQHHPVGEEDPQLGPPTQLALFSLQAA
jgi:3' terminal RNA ribose 2'-O-methyltransferase Hen1